MQINMSQLSEVARHFHEFYVYDGKEEVKHEQSNNNNKKSLKFSVHKLHEIHS